MWNIILVRLEIVLVLVQDRCTVCTEHTIGIEIILEHSIGLLGEEAQLEAQIGARIMSNAP
jgi:hypothetical protein